MQLGISLRLLLAEDQSVRGRARTPPHIVTLNLTHTHIPPALPKPQPQIHNLRSDMAREANIKGIEAVGNKTANTKRGVTDGQVRPSCKRQKVQKTDDEIKGPTEQVEGKLPRKDEVFRFMDLPGELRNEVYIHAAEYAHRCFPPIFPKDKSEARSGSFQAKAHPKLLPHIGLTQACSILRSEFRPTWLSTHKIPLCALDGYLKVFYPRTVPGASPEAKKRFESQYSRCGSLRIWIRNKELSSIDIGRLLKHATRFPDFTITASASLDVHPDVLLAIQTVISNKAARWVAGIKGNKISQICVASTPYGQDPCLFVKIVVKEKYAPGWMKVLLPSARRMPSDFTENLGLGRETNMMRVSFGVDYS